MGDLSERSGDTTVTTLAFGEGLPTRRSALQTLLGAFLLITGATFIAPVIAYMSPRKSKAGQNVLTDRDGRAMSMKDLEGQAFVVGAGIDDEPTIVLRYAGELRAFSAQCTHLGCLVKWSAAGAEFTCPCHGGKFDANGVNVGGPPPAPLKRFRARATADGQIGLERWTA